MREKKLFLTTEEKKNIEVGGCAGVPLRKDNNKIQPPPPWGLFVFNQFYDIFRTFLFGVKIPIFDFFVRRGGEDVFL